jgi:hypothetical protein
MHLYQLDKLVVAEYTIKAGQHIINVKITMVMARMAGYMDYLVEEATEIWLHPDNFSRDNGFTLGQSKEQWKGGLVRVASRQMMTV